MIDIQRFFDIMFLEKNITHGRLILFGRENELRMINNNPDGIYNDSIDATHSAIENLDMIMKQKTFNKGQRKGGTSAKVQARGLIEVYIANNIGFARSKFGGKDDSRFITMFPNLMKSFYHVADIIFETHVKALIQQAHNYASVLGNDFENDLTNLYNNYSVADETHGSQMVAYSNDIVTEQMAAEALADQLTDNVLVIAHHNRGSNIAAQIYFNPALLYPSKRKSRVKASVPAFTEQEVCEIDYSPGKHTHIHNNGACPLTFGMKLNGEKVGRTITLMPDKKFKGEFNYYYTNGTSFYVINESEMAGQFKFNIVA